ncbi:DUF2157 domain-containing protein [Alkalicoccus daliensis]|uniref:Uncharacterized membrane protein n=1 Tax=Alkalicoccus daliensis TaxID=745820 RepID=A0A1G9ZFL7_9BACI|nr:DUF2157 domain-containing protein [Alkalicoccus daliensis]SDN20139.1 Uncharacterized membrane protein [Alkalicoccus daliensis]
MESIQVPIIRWTYVLGISLLIAAAVFYAETWWNVMERLGQTAVITGFVLVFFGFTYLFQKNNPFFSRLSFLAGLISLGPAIMLIGNIYHSQAEAYWLFIFWLLPVILVTLQSKSLSFLLLRFFLVQSLLWTLLFPTYQTWSEGILLTGFIISSIVNAGFYLWSARAGSPKILQAAWFAAVHIFGAAGAVRYVLPDYELLANGYYLVLLTVCFLLFRKKSTELRITIAASSFYLGQLVLLSMIDIVNSMIFLLIFLLAGAAVYGSIKLIKTLNKGSSSQKWKDFSLHAVTILGALIAAVSFGGFIGVFAYELFSGILFAAGCIAFAAAYFIKKADQYFVQALILFGVFLILGISFNLLIWQLLPILILFALLWQGMGKLQKTALYLTGNIIVLFWMETFLNSAHISALMLLGLNLLVLLLCFLFLKERELYLLAYTGALISGYSLPYTADIGEWLYWSYTGVFFAAASILIYVQLRRKDTSALVITAVFWFILIFVQYIDLFWNYVSISITLAVLGICFVTAAYFMDRNNTSFSNGTGLTWGWSAPVAMAVTFAVILVPAVQSEAALRDGNIYWLEVEHYNAEYMEFDTTAYFEIHNLPEEQYFKKGTFVYGELEEQGSGVYELKRMKSSKEKAAAPFIRGRVTSWGQVDFGLGTYPDAKGEISEVLLRVGTDGVAVVEDVRYK